MKRLIMMVIMFVVCSVITIAGYSAQNPGMVWAATIASAILGSVISWVFESIDSHGYGFKLWWHHIKYWKKDVRLSFSYLFRIQIEGKYLLIRGKKLKNRFQPVGGVYKFYDEAKPTLEKMCYHPDTTMDNTNDTDDLRIFIRGRFLLSYMTWFSSMQNREYDPTREFCEELVETGLLPENLFRKIKYRKISVHNVGVQYSNIMDCDEMVYADIFELKLTDSQVAAIKEAVFQNPDMLCLATAEDIRKMRYDSIECNIGNNAIWLLGG